MIDHNWRELFRRHIVYVRARQGTDLLDGDSPFAWDERIKLRRLIVDTRVSATASTTMSQRGETGSKF